MVFDSIEKWVECFEKAFHFNYNLQNKRADEQINRTTRKDFEKQDSDETAVHVSLSQKFHISFSKLKTNLYGC